MAAYFRPESLSEALLLRARHACTPLAGGTDFYPAESSAEGWTRPGLAHAAHLPSLDLSAIDALRGISEHAERIEIGALFTWRDVLDSALPVCFDALRLAAREVGGRQIQNRATLAGNLCNASPAADGVPPLLALDAQVRLQRNDSARELPLSEFLQGNRTTALADDELLTTIIIPRATHNTRSHFLKLGARKYLVISIAMVAVTLSVDNNGVIDQVAVAVGACSPVATRLSRLEKRLLGQPLISAPEQVEATDLDGLRPIDDVRASANYRRHAAQVLVRRALAELASQTTVEYAA